MNQNHRSAQGSSQNLRALWLRMVLLAVGLAYALMEVRFLARAMGQLWRSRRQLRGDSS